MIVLLSGKIQRFAKDVDVSTCLICPLNVKYPLMSAGMDSLPTSGWRSPWQGRRYSVY
jgi:hypothetical protein